MPKLPGPEDIRKTPYGAPRPRLNAQGSALGAPGRALAGLGKNLAGLGSDLASANAAAEKENYAHVMADAERQRYEAEQNYDTHTDWENRVSGYGQDTTRIQEEAAGRINDPKLRQRFADRFGMDVLQGRTRINNGVRKIQAQNAVGLLENRFKSSLDRLRDPSLSPEDRAEEIAKTRQFAARTHVDMPDFIPRRQVSKLYNAYAQGEVSDRVSGLMQMGQEAKDPVEAQKYFDAAKQALKQAQNPEPLWEDAGGSGGVPTRVPAGDIGGRLMGDLQKDFGLTKAQAAGIAGNLAHESGGFKTLQEIKPVVKGSRGGFGYAQWTGPRRRAFESWVKKNGLDITSYEANYGFLKHELQNTPEGKVLKNIQGAKTADQAARVFSQKFLRPGIPNIRSRVAYAGKFAARPDGPTSSAAPATMIWQAGEKTDPAHAEAMKGFMAQGLDHTQSAALAATGATEAVPEIIEKMRTASNGDAALSIAAGIMGMGKSKVSPEYKSAYKLMNGILGDGKLQKAVKVAGLFPKSQYNRHLSEITKVEKSFYQKWKADRVGPGGLYGLRLKELRETGETPSLDPGMEERIMGRDKWLEQKGEEEAAAAYYRATHGLDRKSDEELFAHVDGLREAAKDKNDPNHRILSYMAEQADLAEKAIIKTRQDDPALSVGEYSVGKGDKTHSFTGYDFVNEAAVLARREPSPQNIQAEATARLKAQIMTGLDNPVPLTNEQAKKYAAPVLMVGSEAMFYPQREQAIKDMVKQIEADYGDLAGEVLAQMPAALAKSRGARETFLIMKMTSEAVTNAEDNPFAIADNIDNLQLLREQLASEQAMNINPSEQSTMFPVPETPVQQPTNYELDPNFVPSRQSTMGSAPPKGAIDFLTGNPSPEMIKAFNLKYNKGQPGLAEQKLEEQQNGRQP